MTMDTPSEPAGPFVARRDTQSGSPIKVLYIGGLGRTGSTLLDRVLGQIPGFSSVGELREIWTNGLGENRQCGCGAPFRECPFWTEVGLSAFGGWARLDAKEVARLAASVERHRFVPVMLAPGLSPSYQRRTTRYLSYLSRLYSAIQEVAGSRVIVDSSKAPAYAYLLRRISELDLHVLHLVRDSRGIAYSWSKFVPTRDTFEQTAYLERYSPVRVSARYLSRNALVELLAKFGTPTMRVRYESFIQTPPQQIRSVLDFLKERVGDSQLAFISDHQVDLGINHTVQGNPVRMHLGPLDLRLDNDWMVSMPARQTLIVSALTFPFLRRYGYSWSGRIHP